jgi:hypothetical protein
VVVAVEVGFDAAVPRQQGDYLAGVFERLRACQRVVAADERDLTGVAGGGQLAVEPGKLARVDAAFARAIADGRCGSGFESGHRVGVEHQEADRSGAEGVVVVGEAEGGGDAPLFVVGDGEVVVAEQVADRMAEAVEQRQQAGERGEVPVDEIAEVEAARSATAARSLSGVAR